MQFLEQAQVLHLWASLACGAKLCACTKTAIALNLEQPVGERYEVPQIVRVKFEHGRNCEVLKLYSKSILLQGLKDPVPTSGDPYGATPCPDLGGEPALSVQLLGAFIFFTCPSNPGQENTNLTKCVEGYELLRNLKVSGFFRVTSEKNSPQSHGHISLILDSCPAEG